MDRRQAKTRKAIYTAFGRLLRHGRYEHITVQEIIDEANVGRSTFYAHFETKDHLIKAMCEEIFDHVFEGHPCEYSEKESTVCVRLGHVLWHLKHTEVGLPEILPSESGDLFLGYMKEYLAVLFGQYLPKEEEIPADFHLHHLVGSFTECVKWWAKNGMEPSPEEMAKYFVTVTGLE